MKILALLRLPCFALAVAGLTACGSDPGQTWTATKMKSTIMPAFSTLLGRKKPASTGIGLTRANLATFKTPVDLVTIESRNAQGIIVKIATNRDVETWASADSKTLSFRNGVIVATRGLGDDLMSAFVPRIAQLNGPASQHSRIHTVLNGEDKPVLLRYNCITAKAPPETITVVERSYQTQSIVESCSGPDGDFTNQYWFEANGTLRKSRQWVSKSVKYVVIEHLK